MSAPLFAEYIVGLIITDKERFIINNGKAMRGYFAGRHENRGLKKCEDILAEVSCE